MGLAEDWGIKAIAFDIDGTLYPKSALNLRLAVSSVLHLPFAIRYNRARQIIRKEDGMEMRPAVSLPEFQKRVCSLMYPGASTDRLEWFRKKEDRVFHSAWNRLFLSIREYPGMRRALERASSSYVLCALSDFPVGVKLQALGVEQYFSFIATTEDYGALKPSPVPFMAMLESIGLPPQAVLYVGDSERKDVGGAKGVGMKAALISPSSRKVYSKADLVFSSWDEFSAKVLD